MASFEKSSADLRAFEAPEEASLCSFALGREIMLHQPVYVCYTCSYQGEDKEETPLCVCKGCASVCHADHDVQFWTQGKAFCDCFLQGEGEGKGGGCCQIRKESLQRCASLLRTKSASDDPKALSSLDPQVNERSPLEWVDTHATPVLASSDAGDSRSTTDGLVEACKALIGYTKDTFWLGHEDEPLCALEALAKDIYLYHMDRFACKSKPQSGLEWWVQVKKLDSDDASTGAGTGAATGTDVETATSAPTATASVGVDLHYDKDEVIAEAFEIGLYPDISTVTYLSAGQGFAPTAIFDHTAEEEVDKPIPRCAIIHPALGKHVSFNGKLLHGAPGQLADRGPLATRGADSDFTSGQPTQGKTGGGGGGGKFIEGAGAGVQGDPKASRTRYRVTFLVNVWLHHKPVGVFRLSESIIRSMCAGLQTTDVGAGADAGADAGAGASTDIDRDAVAAIMPRTDMRLNLFPSTEGVKSIHVSQDMLPSPSEDLDLAEAAEALSRKGGGGGGGVNIPSGSDSSIISMVIPFLSAEVDWEKDEEESGLSLAIMVPRECLHLPPAALAHKSSRGEEMASTRGLAASTFIVCYTDEASSARLVGDDEDEDEDDDGDWEDVDEDEDAE